LIEQLLSQENTKAWWCRTERVEMSCDLKVKVRELTQKSGLE